MKKYLSIFLILLFLVGVVSPTFAVGDAVTDEVKAEIEELLGRYNEYVLIVNMCDGSLEYDDTDTVAELKFPVLDWFDSDFTLPDDGETAPTPRSRFYGRKITDSRYSSLDDLINLLDSIYTKELSDIYYRSEFAYSFEVSDYGSKFTGFCNYPPYIDIDDMLYTTTSFTDFAILSKRYIDIDTVEVVKSELGYIVTARGSSEFRDGAVSEPDSDVKFLFIEEENGLRISRMEALRDHVVTSDADSNDVEKLKLLFEHYAELLASPSHYNNDKLYILSILSEQAFSNDSKVNVNAFKSEHDQIRNLADIYDLSNLIFTTASAELVYSDIFADGYFSSFERFEPIYYNTKHGLFVNDIHAKLVFSDGTPYFKLTNLSFDDLTFIETERGYVAYNKDTSSIFDIIYIDKVDMFGDGEYTFKISDVKSKYDLTDEEKALLGIN